MSKTKLSDEIKAFTAQHHRPRFLRVVAELLVHDRPEVLGAVCPCCGSRDAVLTERRVVADIIINRRTGRRITAEAAGPELWADLVAAAERCDVPLRCAAAHVEMLLHDGPEHVFASGGNRAGKTTLGLVWFALQIIRRGGKARRFWLVGPTEEKSYRLLEKLCRPTPAGNGGTVAPVLPAALIERMPDSHRASDLRTRLFDGTIIDLRSFNNDPTAGRAKSDPIIAGLVDEAAHLPTDAWMSALRGRCVDFAGRLWLASTAKPASILKELVDKIKEWASLPAEDPRRVSRAHEGSAWIFSMMPMIANPWVPLANIEEAMRTLDMSTPENRRDFLGEWCASTGLCWPNFTEERHIMRHEARRVRDLSARVLASVGAGGHKDITPMVARGLFGRTNPHVRMARASNFEWIIGQDVNLNPMSSALLQITAPADTVEDRDSWHYWILDTVSTPTSNSLAHAERLVSIELARSLDPDGNGSPLRGCGVIVDATAIGRDPTARLHGQSGSVVETFWRAGLDARAPAYRVTPGKPGHHNPPQLARFTLMHRLINEGRLHVFSRAGELLNAFAMQEATDGGIIPLDGRSGRWDKIMGPMDAASYAVYAAATMKAPGVARAW